MSNKRAVPLSQSGFLRQVERGQSVVEFAFLLLPFLLMTIAVIEMGRAWTVKQALANSAREGARILILPYGSDRRCPDIDCSSAVSVTVAALEATRYHLSNAGIDLDQDVTEISLVRERVEGGTVITEPLTTDAFSGEYVGVRIRHKYTSLIQGLFSGSNSTLTMMGTSTMRHE